MPPSPDVLPQLSRAAWRGIAQLAFDQSAGQRVFPWHFPPFPPRWLVQSDGRPFAPCVEAQRNLRTCTSCHREETCIDCHSAQPGGRYSTGKVHTVRSGSARVAASRFSRAMRGSAQAPPRRFAAASVRKLTRGYFPTPSLTSLRGFFAGVIVAAGNLDLTAFDHGADLVTAHHPPSSKGRFAGSRCARVKSASGFTYASASATPTSSLAICWRCDSGALLKMSGMKSLVSTVTKVTGSVDALSASFGS